MTRAEGNPHCGVGGPGCGSDGVRLLVYITFYFVKERLYHLSLLLRELAGFNVASVTTRIVVNALSPDERTLLAGTIADCRGTDDSVEFTEFPVGSNPRALTWRHKDLLLQDFDAIREAYTHVIYTEADILFTFGNFRYWLSYRRTVRPYGLLPAFLRTEYHPTAHCYVPSDFFGPVYVPHLGHVVEGPFALVNAPNPYNPLYILDRELLDEYVTSRSYQQDGSSGLCNWGLPERAAMGLCLEHVPPGFASRYVIPVGLADNRVPSWAWIGHLPNNYAANPESLLGKVPVATLFAGAQTLTSAADRVSRERPRRNAWTDAFPFLTETATVEPSLDRLFLLITEHDTMLEFDSRSAAIRHRPIGIAAYNLCLSLTRGTRLILVDTELAELGLDGTRGSIDWSRHELKFTFYHDGSVSLRARSGFLSADPRGSTAHDRERCLQWERFRLLPLRTLAALAFFGQHTWRTDDDSETMVLAPQPLFLDYPGRSSPFEASALAATILSDEIERRRFFRFGSARFRILGHDSMARMEADRFDMLSPPRWIDVACVDARTVRFWRADDDRARTRVC